MPEGDAERKRRRRIRGVPADKPLCMTLSVRSWVYEEREKEIDSPPLLHGRLVPERERRTTRFGVQAYCSRRSERKKTRRVFSTPAQPAGSAGRGRRRKSIARFHIDLRGGSGRGKKRGEEG